MESKLQRFERLKATMREIDDLTRTQNRCVENCNLRRKSMDEINKEIANCDEMVSSILTNGPSEASEREIRKKAPKRRVKRGEKPKKKEEPKIPEEILQESKDLFELTEQQVEIDDAKVRIKEIESEQKKVKKRIRTKHKVLGNKTCEEYVKFQKYEKEIRIGVMEVQKSKEIFFVWGIAIVVSLTLAVVSYTDEPYDWECTNGENTIKVNQVLDGVSDCADGSDEYEGGFFETTSAEDAESDWQMHHGFYSIMAIAGIPFIALGLWILGVYNGFLKSRYEMEEIVNDDLKAEKDAHAEIFVLHNRAISESKRLTKDKKRATEELRAKESRKSMSIILISKSKQNRLELVSKYRIQKDRLSSSLELLESTEVMIKEKYDSIVDLIPNQI